jgi:O-antigen/teichoic acid export membrane protein
MADRLSLKRAMGAVGGSAGTALTNLLHGLAIMQMCSQKEYGIFAFLLVTQALLMGLSNALLGSPALIELSAGEGPERDQRMCSYLRVNLLLSLIAGLLQATIAWRMDASIITSIAFGLSGLFTTLRWFGRAYDNNTHAHSRVVASDAVYAIIGLLGIVLLFFTQNIGLHQTAWLNAAAAFLALPALSPTYHRLQWNAFTPVFLGKRMANGSSQPDRKELTLKPFREGFNRQGKHALLGVLTTEATANAHPYTVTLLLGSEAFAPLAAAMLLFRPLAVVNMGLTQVERPRLRKLIQNGEAKHAQKSLRRFRIMNLSAWLGNVLLACGILVFAEGYYWKDQSSMPVFQSSLYMLIFIRLLSTLRAPGSVLWQAHDRFRALSRFTLYSAIITLPSTAILAYYMGAEASLIGVLAGECLLLFLILGTINKELSNER